MSITTLQEFNQAIFDKYATGLDKEDVAGELAVENRKADLIAILEEADRNLMREPIGAYQHWDRVRITTELVTIYGDGEDFEPEDAHDYEEDDGEDDHELLDEIINRDFDAIDEDFFEVTEDSEEWDDEDEKLAQEGYGPDETEEDEDDWSIDVEAETKAMENEISSFFGGDRGVAWDIVTPGDTEVLADRADTEEDWDDENPVDNEKEELAHDGSYQDTESDDTQEVEAVEPQWYDDLIITKGKGNELNKAKTIEAMVKVLTTADATKLTAKQMAELIAPVLSVKFPATKMSVGYAKAYIDYLVNSERLIL